MTFEQFEHLAADYNVIPLQTTVPADTLTPVSCYLALRTAGRDSFLFESVERHDRIGRFSFVGFDPRVTLTALEAGVRIVEDGNQRIVEDSIFAVLERMTAMYRSVPGSPGGGFRGGWAGYLGYDAVATLERVRLPAGDDESHPPAHFGLFTSVVRFDHAREEACAIQNVVIDPALPLRGQYDRGVQRLETTLLTLRRPVLPTTPFGVRTEHTQNSAVQAAFEEGVRRARKYIHEGDIFQVVLSRRLSIPYTGDSFAVYRSLRHINPSPYLFHMDLGPLRISGSSPEVLVRLSGDEIEVLPIAGTRRRGASPDEDRRNASDLVEDRKERAEHVMLVDLGRNDVGRVSVPGTVEVREFMTVERFSHVMHMVSRVRGRRRPGAGAVDVLRACFPAGTVTGAPKVRAMEIITELEGMRRGVYGGAVGYIGFDGTMDMCIAIRTVVAHRNRLHIQSGAGIVAASDPVTEYHETRAKAEALLQAVRTAATGPAGVLRTADPGRHEP